MGCWNDGKLCVLGRIEDVEELADVIVGTIPGGTELTEPLTVEDGKTVVCDGDLSLGTAGSPITTDILPMLISRGSTVVVEGNLEMYRTVAAPTNRMLYMHSGGRLIVYGTTTIIDVGGGSNDVIRMSVGCEFLPMGDVTIVSDAIRPGHGLVSVWYGSRILALSEVGTVNVSITGSASGNGYLLSMSTCSRFVSYGGTLSLTSTGALTGYSFGINAEMDCFVDVLGDISISAPLATGRAVGLLNGAYMIVRTGNLTIDTPSSPGPAIQAYAGCKLFSSSSSKVATITLKDDAPVSSPAVLALEGSLIKSFGIIDVLAHGNGSSPSVEGTILTADKGSTVILKGIKLNGGGDLAMGDKSMVLADRRSDIHITGAAGDSDALNTTDPAAPACTGVRTRRGSQFFGPAWPANTGIGSAPAAINGRDVQCGGSVAADYAGTEFLTDLAAGSPELCLVDKS